MLRVQKHFETRPPPITLDALREQRLRILTFFLFAVSGLREKTQSLFSPLPHSDFPMSNFYPPAAFLSAFLLGFCLFWRWGGP